MIHPISGQNGEGYGIASASGLNELAILLNYPLPKNSNLSLLPSRFTTEVTQTVKSDPNFFQQLSSNGQAALNFILHLYQKPEEEKVNDVSQRAIRQQDNPLNASAQMKPNSRLLSQQQSSAYAARAVLHDQTLTESEKQIATSLLHKLGIGFNEANFVERLAEHSERVVELSISDAELAVTVKVLQIDSYILNTKILNPDAPGNVTAEQVNNLDKMVQANAEISLQQATAEKRRRRPTQQLIQQASDLEKEQSSKRHENESLMNTSRELINSVKVENAKSYKKLNESGVSTLIKGVIGIGVLGVIVGVVSKATKNNSKDNKQNK